MEDYELDIVIGQGPSARSVKVPVQRFTLVGATTRTGLLTSPLRARFGIVHRLDFYNEDDIHEIVDSIGADPRRADRRGRGAGDRAALSRNAARGQPAAAPCSRLRPGPRRRHRSPPTSRARALALLEVDEHGFDEVDRRLLRIIIEKFGGGPVGVASLAAAMSEERDAHRRHLRAVPDPDRISRSHAAGPRGHGPRLRILRADRPAKGQIVVNAPVMPVSGPLACARSRLPASRPTCRRSCSPTTTSRRWSRPATSGSCSAPASANATSPTRASRRRIWRRRPSLGAMAEAGLTPDQLGFIVVGTTTPDTIFPSTACMLQDKLGAHHAWGFDLGAACSGFTYSLTVGMQMVASGAHDHALVVGADVMSSIIDYTDRTTCVLFGDGAGAVVLSPAGADEPPHHRLRARDRRQRRPRSVHARRRQPPAGIASRPSTSGCTTSSRKGRPCSSSRSRRPKRFRGACSIAQRHAARRARSVRVAPGQPPHHRSLDRAPGARTRQGDHQPRALRQHHRRHDPAGARRRTCARDG